MVEANYTSLTARTLKALFQTVKPSEGAGLLRLMATFMRETSMETRLKEKEYLEMPKVYTEGSSKTAKCMVMESIKGRMEYSSRADFRMASRPKASLFGDRKVSTRIKELW